MFEARKEFAEKFIETAGFGITTRELTRYLEKTTGSSAASIINFLTESFIKIPHWNAFALALLQHEKRPSLFISGRLAPSRRTSRRLLSQSLVNEKIFSKTESAALIRIFLEIDFCIGKMLRRKQVSRCCGYEILQLLLKSKEPLVIDEIYSAFEFIIKEKKEFQLRFRQKYLLPLLNLGLIEVHKGRFRLTDKTLFLFREMGGFRGRLIHFPYRIKWFYPYEK